jgi:hypothetical protein
VKSSTTSFRTAENHQTKLKKGRPQNMGSASTRPCGTVIADPAPKLTWDWFGRPVTVGARVHRARDWEERPDVAEGRVESVDARTGRCHVRWADDPHGTYPYCARLVVLQEESAA